MLYNRVTLFRIFGFPVRADASWLILSVFISWTLASGVFPAQYPGYSDNVYQVMGITAFAGLLISILAHELAHAIVAQNYHMPIASITLFIFGGVAEMTRPPSEPKGEFLMAAAGPAMSLLMSVFFWANDYFYQSLFAVNPVSQVLEFLAVANILIAGFNSVPAFPLDGGRMLRAAIWHYSKNMVLATRVASGLGGLLSYALLAWGCWLVVHDQSFVSGIWTGLLGILLLAAGKRAVRDTESRSLLAGISVARFARSDFVSVSPDITISSFVGDFVYRHYQKTFPVVDGDRLVGIISLRDILKVSRDEWNWIHVSSVMEKMSDETSADLNASAADALALMERMGSDQLMVTSQGRWVGVLFRRDLVNYVTITIKLDQDSPLRPSPAEGMEAE